MISAPTKPSTLHSPLLLALGVPHAFSTRHGGVSGGIFASLNFGNPGDLPADQRDPRANIEQNWDLLKHAIALANQAGPQAIVARRIVEVHQVHGREVVVARRGSPTPRGPDGRDPKADALVTDDPARLAAVRVADCTPVLIASADGRIVTAVHAGWRGTVAGIINAAIKAMTALGAPPTEMTAAVGPCIGPDAFEVGPEVAAEFKSTFGATTPHVRTSSHESKSLVDLKGALREQLIAAGLEPRRIDVLHHCTVRDAADFFSHRREQGLTGRMVGVIGPRE